MADQWTGFQLQAPTESSPALAYLSRLKNDDMRRQRTRALQAIIQLALGGCDHPPLEALYVFPWHELRCRQTQAIRAMLEGYVSPRTARTLSVNSRRSVMAALRGVLKECWRLGLMSAEDFQRATDLSPVRAAAAPFGRNLP